MMVRKIKELRQILEIFVEDNTTLLRAGVAKLFLDFILFDWVKENERFFSDNIALIPSLF